MNICNAKPGFSLELTVPRALLFISLIWAGICLPGLGSLEIDFNEGRRILPAVGMIESGDWMNPMLSGKEYLRKPPLINWLIAASFKISGIRSEFAARLPSALFMLVFASALVAMPSAWLSLSARFVSAIVFLSSAGMIENGRMAEIDCAYACLAGLALLCRFNFDTAAKPHKWLAWILPGVILGLGLLLKGPIILFFYYVPVICILAFERRLKELLSVGHIAGIIMMLLIFFSWAYFAAPPQKPALEKSGESKMIDTWIFEIGKRFKDEDVKISKWIKRVLGAFAGFAPWLIFVPFLWNRKWVSRIDEPRQQMFRACRLALVLSFVIVNLMPGTKARYSLPLYGLAAMLTGWILSGGQNQLLEKIWKAVLYAAFSILAAGIVLSVGVVFVWNIAPEYFEWRPEFKMLSLYSGDDGMLMLLSGSFMAYGFYLLFKHRSLAQGVQRLAGLTGIFAVAGMVFYAVFAMPAVKSRQKGHCALAGEINNITSGQPLYAYSIESEPFLFYIAPKVEYLLEKGGITDEVKFLLCRKELMDELRNDPAFSMKAFSSLKVFPHRRTEYELAGLSAKEVKSVKKGKKGKQAKTQDGGEKKEEH